MPFRANTPQRRYFDDITSQGVVRDIVGKSRKWGFSTLRLGLLLHRCMYTPGRIGRVVAHKQTTSEELNGILKLLYKSAWAYFVEIGEDPAYFMPKSTGDTVYGYKFGEIKSAVRFDTAGGKGVGQAERNDELYLTEYSDWDRADEVYAGLRGSMPAGSDGNIITIDFNPHGTGSDAYNTWQKANLEHTDIYWNGFVPFFQGVDDFPEYYTPDMLVQAEKELQKRFRAVYPRTPEEMWLQGEGAVHAAEEIDRCTESQYLMDFLTDAEIRQLDILHGVDTATGKPDGDWQTCVTLGCYQGRVWEVCPPLRLRIPEDVFGERVNERVRDLPGVCVVERNVGSAVIIRLRELGTPNLYKHKHRDKSGRQRREIGFPTTYGTKRQMIAQTDRLLREGGLGLVTPWIIQEFKEVEWKTTKDGTEAHGLAGAPAREGAHDDGWIGVMIGLQGQNYYGGPLGG